MLIHFSSVQFFATLCIVACQLPCPWDLPSKNTGVGCHSLLQGIVPTQGSIETVSLGLLHLPHWQRCSLPLAPPRKPFSLLVCVCVFLVVQWCRTVGDHTGCSLPGSSVHRDSLGKNIGVGCHALLQGIFPTLGGNPGLPHCRQILYCLSHQGSP